MSQFGSMKVQQLFPSEDGNLAQRQYVMKLIEQIVSGVDELKIRIKSYERHKGPKWELLSEFNLGVGTSIPETGAPLEEVNQQLLELLHSHPYHTKYSLD